MFSAPEVSAAGGRYILKFMGTFVALLSWQNCLTIPPNMRAVLRIVAMSARLLSDRYRYVVQKNVDLCQCICTHSRLFYLILFFSPRGLCSFSHSQSIALRFPRNFEECSPPINSKRYISFFFFFFSNGLQQS